MIELDEFKAKLKTYEQPLEEMRSSLDLENKERRIEELERTMAEPSFWGRGDLQPPAQPV